MDNDQEKFDAADLIIPPIEEVTVVGSVIFRDDGVDEEQEKFEADWTATKNEPCKVSGCQQPQYGESGVCFRHLLDEVRGEKYSRLDGK